MKKNILLRKIAMFFGFCRSVRWCYCTANFHHAKWRRKFRF